MEVVRALAAGEAVLSNAMQGEVLLLEKWCRILGAYWLPIRGIERLQCDYPVGMYYMTVRNAPRILARRTLIEGLSCTLPSSRSIYTECCGEPETPMTHLLRWLHYTGRHYRALQEAWRAIVTEFRSEEWVFGEAELAGGGVHAGQMHAMLASAQGRPFASVDHLAYFARKFAWHWRQLLYWVDNNEWERCGLRLEPVSRDDPVPQIGSLLECSENTLSTCTE